MTDISDLVARLRETADPTSIYADLPWWWNCPEKGGPGPLLREAADALEKSVEPAFCCDREKTRGPNVSGKMVCPIHCSKCSHERKFEDYFDFCSECQFGDPCYRK